MIRSRRSGVRAALLTLAVALVGIRGGDLQAGESLDASLPRAFVAQRPAPPGTWEKRAIDGSFPGRTVALPVATRIYFFYQDRLGILDLQSGDWTHPRQAFPFHVDDGFAAASDASGIYFLGGEEPRLYRLEPDGLGLTALAPIPQRPRRGARLTADGRGNLYAVVAGGHPKEGGSKSFFRYQITADRWQRLSDVESVNNPGRYSSGLHHVGGSLYTYGDHHVARYDIAAGTWQVLFYVMRYRPFLERGGMSAVDPETHSIYVTLGGESNSLGVLSAEATFHYLRPRLPLALGEPGETLFVAGAGSGKRLYLLSNRERAIYSIATEALSRIGAPEAGKAADHDSPWEIQNVYRGGAHGGLFRHRDSYGSGAYLAPYFYYQRKNVLRRVDPLTSWVSPHKGVYKFHREFSTREAAITSDGENREISSASSSIGSSPTRKSPVVTSIAARPALSAFAL